MSETAIKVQDICKVYKLYESPKMRVKEALSPSKKEYHKKFEALKGVSFEVKKGEMLGIIGKNGAGKSTLLKIITGVLTPSSGDIEINGKISALLELGAGFNPEYTGLENIYLNGTMIGYTREEMDQKVDSIIEFADIGDFIYQPVKTYSSGMFARLAFAVSINVDPDILIVDEALSVGDVFFQTKCYKKLEDLKKAGKTILFVTHDLGSVIRYCDRALIISEGRNIAEGKPDAIVDIFKKILVGQYNPEQSDELGVSEEALQGNLWKNYMAINPNGEEYGDMRAEIIDFGIFDEEDIVTNTLLKFQKFKLKMKIKFNAPIENPIFAFSVRDAKGTELFGTNTMYEKVETGMAKPGDIYEVEFEQKMMLQNGQYLLLLGCTGFEREELQVYDRLYNICCIDVISDKVTVGYFDANSKVTLRQEKK